jgi:predicted nuclease of predicted toxin-antitoxin system
MADALIAATAIVHRKTVVTRNASDFKDLSVRVIDPWSIGWSRAKEADLRGRPRTAP